MKAEFIGYTIMLLAFTLAVINLTTKKMSTKATLLIQLSVVAVVAVALVGVGIK